jgi:hypothetical protein
MSRDLWLADVEHFDVKADAYFIVSHEADQTQSRSISQRLEKQFDVVFCAAHSGLFFCDIDTI